MKQNRISAAFIMLLMAYENTYHDTIEVERRSRIMSV